MIKMSLTSDKEGYETEQFIIRRNKETGIWTLRNKLNNLIVDADRYRHDLAERNKFKLEAGCSH